MVINLGIRSIVKLSDYDKVIKTAFLLNITECVLDCGGREEGGRRHGLS